MTVFRADQPRRRPARRWPLVLLAALFAALPLALAAQDGTGPIRLIPPRVAPPAATPAPMTTPPTPVPAAEAPATATGADFAVRVDSLPQVDWDSVGTLSPAQGGLGPQMWAGSSRAFVESMVAEVPSRPASAAMRSLFRRVLLTPAAVPPLAPGGASKPGDLLAARAAQLLMLGDLEGTSALVNAAPPGTEHSALRRVQVEAELSQNNNARACAVTTQEIMVRATAYWQKLGAFCQVLAGDRLRGGLALTILRENSEQDAVFFRLMDALIAGDAQPIASMPKPTALHLAIVRAAKAQLPADTVSTDDPAMLRVLATAPNLKIESRLEAAERAAALGALNIDALRQLYAAYPFSEDDLRDPLARSASVPGAVGRALLYRTAALQTVPTAQAEASAKALALGRASGRYLLAAETFLPVVRKVPPSNDLLWFAPEAIFVLLTASEGEAADGWLRLIATAAPLDGDAQKMLARIRPLAVLAGVAESEGIAQDLDAWLNLQPKAEATVRAELLYTMLKALGHPVGHDVWMPLIRARGLTTAPMPPAAIWRALDIAVNENRVGEVALLALASLGTGGPQGAHPIVLGAVLESLAAVGLEETARGLALEAATSAGL